MSGPAREGAGKALPRMEPSGPANRVRKGWSTIVTARQALTVNPVRGSERQRQLSRTDVTAGETAPEEQQAGLTLRVFKIPDAGDTGRGSNKLV